MEINGESDMKPIHCCSSSMNSQAVSDLMENKGTTYPLTLHTRAK